MNFPTFVAALDAKMNQMTEIKPRKEFVFRLEDAEGTGIYRTLYAQELYALDSAAGGTAHPHPNQDSKLSDHWDMLIIMNQNKEYYFGFASMEQLRRWLFDKEVNQTLHDGGIKISIYQTDDYYIGDTQMMFRKSSATLIGKADLV